jgi:SWI/SNF-related matrix-associated actin-dependent regulator of chromatin subfamily A-like protein 1
MTTLVATPLPQHLERPRLQGTPLAALRRTTIRGESFWELEGDPQVIIMAKRLFPGSKGREAGHCTFPTTGRTFGDLIWFQQRWPITIEAVEDWERAYEASTQYALRRDALNRTPASSVPPAMFRGLLKPFQGEGLSFMLTNRRTLLADEMGLGKTPQALAFLAAAEAWPALIVPPPHLLRHWGQKIEEFLTTEDFPLFRGAAEGVTTHVIRGRRPYALPEAHIYLIHYLLLESWRNALADQGIKTVIFDEVQDLRHTGTLKYSAASVISSKAENVIGLSGTPIYNRGAEIWAVTNILEYHCLGDSDSFTREWCSGYGTDKVQHPDVLGAHLRREGLMLRRRKEDVLAQLPPKRRIVETIDGDAGQFADLVRTAVDIAKGMSAVKDPLARGRMTREAIEETRRATGISKAPAAAIFIAGLMEAEEPTLVFAHHHAVVDILKEALAAYSPVCITGRESEAEKWQAKEAFRTGESSCCIISLRAASGIDGLQERARCVVFAELDWSPAVHSQAEDRAHRMGLQDSVLCYYLVTEFGTDPDMQEVLGLKVSQFIGLMGDKVESEADRELAATEVSGHMSRVLTRLRAMKGNAQEKKNQS